MAVGYRSPPIVLFPRVVLGCGCPAAFLADAGDDGLDVGGDGTGAVAELVEFLAGVEGDEAALDGTFHATGHLVEEVDHATGVADDLVLPIHGTAAGLHFRMHGVDAGDADGVLCGVLSHQPVQAGFVAFAVVVEAGQIAGRLLT